MKLGWNNEYSEYIHALYPDPKLKTRSITFQITDSCNLKCSYCLTGDTTILMSDFSYKEISKLLDIPVSTIDGKLCKIRRILKETLNNTL